MDAFGLFDKALRVLRRDLQQPLQVVRYRAGQHDAPQVGHGVPDKHLGIAALAHHLVDLTQGRGRVAVDQGVHKLKHRPAPRRAQHVPGQLSRYLAVGIGQAHVQQAQGVAHRALGGPGDLGEGLLRGAAPDAREHHLQPVDDHFHGYPVEVKALAA